MPLPSCMCFTHHASSWHGRFAWQHYIPHRKADDLGSGKLVPRGTRVSLTLRKVRGLRWRPAYPALMSLCMHQSPAPLLHPRLATLVHTQVRGFACDCTWPDACDSQSGGAPPTRLAMLRLQQEEQQQGQEQEGGQAQGASSSGTGQGSAAAQGQGQGPCSAAHSNGHTTEGQQQGAGPAGAGKGQSTGAPAAAGLAGGGTTLEELEAEHVVAVYDAIAQHFSSTR